MDIKTVLLVGDSIRIGYEPYVRDSLGSFISVVAPQENGGTSINLLQHLDKWFIASNADIIHFNCGLHDLAKDINAADCWVPIKQYEKNLREIMRRLKNESQSRIIWATTTPVDEVLHRKRGFDRLESYVREYNETANQIAGEFSVAVNDLYSVMIKAGKENYLTSEGVHFSSEGYRLLGEAVTDFIRICL